MIFFQIAFLVLVGAGLLGAIAVLVYLHWPPTSRPPDPAPRTPPTDEAN